MKPDKPISVESLTLKELLSQNLKIPEYQRPYVWDEKMVLKFLNQINFHFQRVNNNVENYPLYYLGCIVLHYDGKQFNVIDGQQRLTTLILISKLKGVLSNDLLFYHPLSFQNIKKNFSFLNSEFGNINSNVRKLIDQISFDQLNVTVIITKNEDQAYNFFETLNTGGVRLSGTDILKAHHLRSISSDKMKDYAKSWEKRQKHLEIVSQILLKSRKMNPLKNNLFPGKYGSVTEWKVALTEEFAEKTGKEGKDIGFADVQIEKETHTILSDRYSIRQPLNDGENYINYLLTFTEDYEDLFFPSKTSDFYKNFNREIIDLIDGTYDLKAYYQVALICFVNKFGKDHMEEFSMWLFRFVYSLRIGDKTRIYEATVKNFFSDTQLLQRILYSYTYDEILEYLKKQKFEIKSEINGVRWRFLDRIKRFFNLEAIENSFINLDDQLIKVIEDNYGKKRR